MKVLDIVLMPLLTFILLAVGYGYGLGGGQHQFTWNLVKWAIIFVVLSALARMCIPH